jgi:hypothetical protein
MRNKEIEMTTQTVFCFTQLPNTITDDRSSLESVRRCLVATGFELLEIREFDSGEADETWISPASEKRIQIFVNDTAPASEDEADASRTELIGEVVDLWFVLRAIRNLLSEEPDVSALKKPETPMERFMDTVREFREERENAPDNWNFLFAPDVDEVVCAFNVLDDSDRLALTH